MTPSGPLSPYLSGRLVLLENSGFQQLVDQLLHRIECTQKSLRRHDDALFDHRNRGFAFHFRLKRHEIKSDHSAGKVNPADAC